MTTDTSTYIENGIDNHVSKDCNYQQHRSQKLSLNEELILTLSMSLDPDVTQHHFHASNDTNLQS